MNHFHYKGGVLHAENVSLTDIADAVGTPFYCYSTATLERHFKVFSAALPKDSLVAFSVKANNNLAVLKTLANLGAGADVVSGGELRRALAAGIPPDKIVFSGVGKTKNELTAALAAGIYQFNVESEPELIALDRVAEGLNRKAPVAIRINPDVDAHTHAKISTGHAETKFGIPWSRARDAYALAASLGFIDIVGIDMHIGSQVSDLAPFEAAFAKLTDYAKELRASGFAISRIDFGGGLGVPYRSDNAPPPDPSEYGRLAAGALKGLDAQLIVEPGRLIAANAGVLVATVTYVKHGENKDFLILDAGMNDLIRPAMYDAYHGIVAVEAPLPDAPLHDYDVVGPVCETGDCFARARPLPPLKSGDAVAILAAGAYGATMSSAYNARPPAPEVLVKDDAYAVVRPRLDDDAFLTADRIPDWLRKA
jgi:diaminopimelate decarboxylase